MLALTAPSAGWHALFLAVALVLFLLAMFKIATKVELIAAGLAVVTALYFWSALART